MSLAYTDTYTVLKFMHVIACTLTVMYTARYIYISTDKPAFSGNKPGFSTDKPSFSLTEHLASQIPNNSRSLDYRLSVTNLVYQPIIPGFWATNQVYPLIS